MNHPIDELIEARKAHQEGRREDAAQLLASSVGAEGPTQLLEENLDALLEHPQGRQVVYRLVGNEIRRRKL